MTFTTIEYNLSNTLKYFSRVIARVTYRTFYYIDTYYLLPLLK